jgi:hypothetical protein
MTGPARYDAAAELASLAGWIDAQLADERADRQQIAESAAASVRDIILALRGGAAPLEAAAGVMGPFDTERQASGVPAVRAIYDAFRAAPGAGRMAALNHRLLADACAAAGVSLGAYERRILLWLAGWEPQTCAVVAGLVTRARVTSASPGRGQIVLTAAQSACLRGMLADAIAYRGPRVGTACADCGDIDDDGACHGLCDDHAADRDLAADYRALASELGVTL